MEDKVIGGDFILMDDYFRLQNFEQISVFLNNEKIEQMTCPLYSLGSSSMEYSFNVAGRWVFDNLFSQPTKKYSSRANF